ncbi:Serine/threonine protein kinase [Pandoravirus salinus]|uniref:Serine/threonine protein kinase n=1 Tax=Pandoravirus salinus TaxID=1349410 RepID=A0A291ATM2_9VIRU|nr:Serine/threonine protein kinase [Pandoravirus salinus]ATE82128.1 Serine/threonine protein kinase [Pandoravirus salinus]
MQTSAPNRRERSRRRHPSEMSSSSSSSSLSMSPQPSPRQPSPACVSLPFPALASPMAPTTSGQHGAQPVSVSMPPPSASNARAHAIRSTRAAGRPLDDRRTRARTSDDNDDMDSGDNKDDGDEHADGDSNDADDRGSGSDVDVDTDIECRQAAAESRPLRDHEFARSRSHHHHNHQQDQHRHRPHPRHYQHQPQRPMTCRQTQQTNERGPRIIDRRRAAPSAHGPRVDGTRRVHPPASSALPTIVDRRPRASATVPMLPLCETADDAQAVRALSGDKRYAVVRRLGSGASSSVFLACDRLRADALVAIKVVSDAKVSRSEILAGTFLCGHRSIAAMIDWFPARDHYFLVFEHVDGPDLQVLWAGLPATRNFFAEDAFRRVFLCVLDAVAYCHAHGVVHRDIKMENVVVRDDGASACLVDFGFAFFVRPPHALLDPGCGVGAAAADFGAMGGASTSMRAGSVIDAPDHRHRRAAVTLAHQGYGGVGAMHQQGRARCTSMRADASRPPALDCIYRRNRDGMLAAVRMDTPDVLDATNAFVGTEEYCAPELTLGALVEPEDLFATDVYSLGVLLHVALTDRFPQRPEFVHFLIDTRRRLEQAWHRTDPRAALADPRLVAEINRRGALDLATAPSTSRTPLSVEVCDLIARMLRPVPAERITLAQVRAHPWVTTGRRRR